MNPGFRIKTTFTRPSAATIKAFTGMPAANIGDNMNRIICMDSRVNLYNKGPLLGPAFTVKVRAGDNLMLHKAIDLAQPGDVIVVDVQGDLTYAVIGELMISWARRRGIAGMVIDGAIRDLDTIKSYDNFPVYAVGVTPNGPLKEGAGEIGYDISCGGIVVHPGDIIVGDDDGVAVICPADAEDVLTKTRAIMAKEKQILIDIENLKWDRAWVDKTLNAKGCEFAD